MIHVWRCWSTRSRPGSESHAAPLAGRRLAKSVFNCFYLALECKWHASGMTERLLQHFFFFFRKPTLTHTLPLKSLVLDSGLRRSQDLISVPSQITYTLLGLDKSNASGNPLLIDILDNDVKLNETCASKHINSFFWFCSVTPLKSGIKSRNYTRAFWLNGYFFALSGCSV